MAIQFAGMTSSSILLSGLITGPTPQFHNNIITGSGVMTIFVYKGLTRNPEIGNTSSEFCPIPG